MPSDNALEQTVSKRQGSRFWRSVGAEERSNLGLFSIMTSNDGNLAALRRLK